MFRIGEGRYGISKKERERKSPCLGVERLSEVRHIHNTNVRLWLLAFYAGDS